MRLSVVIPVHNGGADLRACLAGLAESTHKPDEIIVVDDGSSDGAAACAAEFCARVLESQGPPRGPAHARNRGAEAATGEILVFVDADVVVHRKALEQFAEVFRRDAGLAAAFGSYDDQPAAEGRVSRYKNLFHHYVHQHGAREAETFWAGCGAIRRKVFEGLGGFRETYTRPSIEDIELGGRLRAAGKRIALCPEIQCTHRKRWTLISLLRTDIYARAVPWTRLILEQGRLPSGLNTDRRSRWSAALLWLAVLACTGCLFGLGSHSRMGAAAFAIFGLVALLGVTRLNADLYRFFFQHGDRRFGLLAVGLHALYLLYSSLVYALLVGLHRMDNLGGEAPAVQTASPRRKHVAGAILFVVLFAAYVGDGDSLPGNDTTSNTYLAVTLLSTGSLSFTPDNQPALFNWILLRDGKSAHAHVRSWDDLADGRPARDLRKQGLICLPKAPYHLAKTARPEVYVSSYGIVTGLFALPFVASVYPFVPRLAERSALLWFLCKLAAAFAVAGSAWFLFLVAADHLRLATAVGLTLLYGLGTCVWSVSSQALWQHGPAEFFLAIGTFALFRRERGYAPFLAGAAYSLAFLARPSNSVVVLVGFGFFLITERRKVWRYLAGGLPFAVLFLAYNLYFFHRPIVLGQINAITDRVQTATTSLPVEALFKTSLLEGVAGVLVSPSRGLFVFSPILLISMWGCLRIWRDKRWLPLCAAIFAVLGLWFIAARWFGWWGGWCYGYRMVVDSAILLAFLAIPVAEMARQGWGRKTVLAVLALWSIGVQVLGVYAYDVNGWNNREGYEVAMAPVRPLYFDTAAEAHEYCRERGCTYKLVNRNVDEGRFHSRLWKIRDSEILYYLTNLEESHRRRARYWRDFLRNEG